MNDLATPEPIALKRNHATVKRDDFLQEMFLAREDAARCHGSLSKLARHVEEPVVVTGGIACGWHLLKNGVRRKRGRLNDIDVIVEGVSSLRASLGKDFLIRHFHPSRGRGKILIMLVDEEHGTRIDVFTPGTNSLTKRLDEFTIDELPFRLISAEDLLAKLLSIAHVVTEGKPVETKYVEHFYSLSMVADLETTRDLWREYRKENQPLAFDEAAREVKLCVTANPALLQTTPYSQDINEGCSWCQESELFPLASPARIYEILGYV